MGTTISSEGPEKRNNECSLCSNERSVSYSRDLSHLLTRTVVSYFIHPLTVVEGCECFVGTYRQRGHSISDFILGSENK